MINIKKHELKNSFKEHYSIANVAPPSKKKYSHKLLLFYAVECGLKVLIITKISGSTTKDIYNNTKIGPLLNGKSGHNLVVMTKFLGISQFKFPGIDCKNGDVAGCDSYNQLWRYGAECDSNKEDEVVKELEKLATYIKGRI